MTNKEYYWRNREKLLAYKKANRARINAYDRKWRKEKPGYAEWARSYHREWSKKNRGKRYKYWAKAKYGLTPAELDRLHLAQGRRCGICKKRAKLFVDHDHKTNLVRGLLCRKCNSILGWAEDSKQRLAKAIIYLEKTSQKQARSEFLSLIGRAGA